MSYQQFNLLLANIFLATSPLAPAPNLVFGLIYLALAIFANDKRS